MSNDPKKPLDPAPAETPDLLQQELNLDRRKRVPSFEELTHAAAPPRPDTRTVPGTPGPFNANPTAPTTRTTVAPAGTMTPGNPARPPTNFESAPTAQQPHHRPMMSSPSPVPQRAPAAAPPGLQPRVQIAAPTQAPPQAMSPSGRHPPPQMGAHDDATRPGTMPPKRTAPPSPNEWANARALELPTVPVPVLPKLTAAPPMQSSRTPAPQPPPQPQAQTNVLPPHRPAAPMQAQPMPPRTAPEPIVQRAPPAPMPLRTAPEPVAPRAMAPAPQPARSHVQTDPESVQAAPLEQTRSTRPPAELNTAPQRPIMHLPAEDEPLDGPVLPMNLAKTQPAVKNPYPTARRDTPKADTLQAPAEPMVPATRRLEPVTPSPTPPPAISTRLEPAVTARRAQSNDVTAAPASLWRRTFAWTLDLVVITLVVGGFFGAALAVIGKPSPALLLSVAVPALGVVAFVAFVYTTLFAFLWKGRTPGRRLLGIQLVDASGQAPGAVRALIRAGLSLASFGLFLSGFWLALFDRKGQTLHDKLTSTFVVRLRPAS